SRSVGPRSHAERAQGGLKMRFRGKICPIRPPGYAIHEWDGLETPWRAGGRTMRARLIPLDGSDPIEISRDLTVVGRKEDCDLRLDHKSVSKMHCVLVKTDGLLLVRDLGSTNGTRVNGQRIRRAALLPNDQISIAGFKFRVYLGPDAEPVPEDN